MITRRIPGHEWVRLHVGHKWRLQYDRPYRVTRRLWVGPVILLWMPKR